MPGSIGMAARASRIGPIALSHDPEEGTAVEADMGQFRWFTGAWKVNAESPARVAVV